MVHRAELAISLREDPKVVWRYPLLGAAEAARSVSLGRLSCKAREAIR